MPRKRSEHDLESTASHEGLLLYDFKGDAIPANWRKPAKRSTLTNYEKLSLWIQFLLFLSTTWAFVAALIYANIAQGQVGEAKKSNDLPRKPHLVRSCR